MKRGAVSSLWAPLRAYCTAAPAIHLETRNLSVHTLKFDQRQPTDFLDLGNGSKVNITFAHRPSHSCPLRYTPSAGATSIIPFPEDARGFLYYHSPIKPWAGAIRFRITSDSAPSSFHRGRDLCFPSGCPWQVLLSQISSRNEYEPLKAQLLLENLVTEEDIALCRKVFGDHALHDPERLLFTLYQQFPVDLSRPLAVDVLDIPATALLPLRLPDIFTARARGKKFRLFSKGLALARFERSKLPQHAERRVAILRILKILEAPQRTLDGHAFGVAPPAAADIFTSSLNISRGENVRDDSRDAWSLDVDGGGQAAAALRILWRSWIKRKRTPWARRKEEGKLHGWSRPRAPEGLRGQAYAEFAIPKIRRPTTAFVRALRAPLDTPL